ncbi:uncharacterized protein [Triticum aestivum]|uniref:uncharacterized protein n=1 Tax=Triticum aestivum TaxID=4565 RepID=UPI001D00D3B6|nr:uncharacterized protein LOC123129748 [Triticum aestivum]
MASLAELDIHALESKAGICIACSLGTSHHAICSSAHMAAQSHASVHMERCRCMHASGRIRRSMRLARPFSGDTVVLSVRCSIVGPPSASHNLSLLFSSGPHPRALIVSPFFSSLLPPAPLSRARRASAPGGAALEESGVQLVHSLSSTPTPPLSPTTSTLHVLAVRGILGRRGGRWPELARRGRGRSGQGRGGDGARGGQAEVERAAARQRWSARRSRARKQQRLEELHGTVARFRAEKRELAAKQHVVARHELAVRRQNAQLPDARRLLALQRLSSNSGRVVRIRHWQRSGRSRFPAGGRAGAGRSRSSTPVPVGPPRAAPARLSSAARRPRPSLVRRTPPHPGSRLRRTPPSLGRLAAVLPGAQEWKKFHPKSKFSPAAPQEAKKCLLEVPTAGDALSTQAGDKRTRYFHIYYKLRVILDSEMCNRIMPIKLGVKLNFEELLRMRP